MIVVTDIFQDPEVADNMIVAVDFDHEGQPYSRERSIPKATLDGYTELEFRTAIINAVNAIRVDLGATSIYNKFQPLIGQDLEAT